MSGYLKSKPRYEILDGLRGVATVIVVLFHLWESYSKGPQYAVINHGYLAVDFFFMLSGFVVGYAYDDRWGRMSLSDFFKRRLVRLHPMLIFGTLFGGLLFYLGAQDGFPLIGETPWWKMALLTLLGCTAIPALKAWDIRGWEEMNSLNGATWSLFWEYVANILYALIFRFLPKCALAVLVAASAVLTLDLCFDWDMFGILGDRGGASNTVIGGWAVDLTQCYIGLSRLLFPFLCGLLISRVGKFVRVRGGFWWCSLALVAVLCLPYVPGGEKGVWTCVDGIYGAVCILLVFPLVVSVGAGSNVTGKRSVAVCKFLGNISYPLYVTHYPLIYVQMAWISRNTEAPTGVHVVMNIGFFVLMIAVAYASMKLYDIPVREWLRQHVLMKK